MTRSINYKRQGRGSPPGRRVQDKCRERAAEHGPETLVVGTTGSESLAGETIFLFIFFNFPQLKWAGREEITMWRSCVMFSSQRTLVNLCSERSSPMVKPNGAHLRPGALFWRLTAAHAGGRTHRWAWAAAGPGPNLLSLSQREESQLKCGIWQVSDVINLNCVPSITKVKISQRPSHVLTLID